MPRKAATQTKGLIPEEVAFRAFCDHDSDELFSLSKKLTTEGWGASAKRLAAMADRHNWRSRKVALQIEPQLDKVKALVEGLTAVGDAYNQQRAIKGVMSRVTAEIVVAMETGKPPDYLLACTEIYERWNELYVRSMQATLDQAGARIAEIEAEARAKSDRKADAEGRPSIATALNVEPFNRRKAT